MIPRSERVGRRKLYAVWGRYIDASTRVGPRRDRWLEAWRRRWREENARCGSCQFSNRVWVVSRDGVRSLLADAVRCDLDGDLHAFDARPCGEWEWSA